MAGGAFEAAAQARHRLMFLRSARSAPPTLIRGVRSNGKSQPEAVVQPTPQP
jgi:hypothetical protein